MADSNLTNLGYVAETTFGTTPGSALQILRKTGGNLSPRREFTTSEEIRSDLRAGRAIRTAERSQGDVNFEWSYGTVDDILAGLLMEDWASDVLVDGTTKKSFTFEDQVVDPDISPGEYFVHKGCRIASLSMSLGIGSPVTGTMGVQGTTPSLAQASAGTGSATAATTTSIFNTVDMVEALEEGAAGSTPAAINKIQGVELSIERALGSKQEIGSLNDFDIRTGRLMVTGSITEYFESARLADEWFSFSDRQLIIELQDAAGNNIKAEIPKLNFVGDLDLQIPGPDDDVLASYNFQAYADVGDAALIRFTRTAA